MAGRKLQQQWRIEKVGSLTLVFSPLLAKYPQLTHAFTTRLGGSSPKPIDSFNLSLTRTVAGSKNDAIKNRRNLCKALKLNPKRLVVPYQTHSPKVAWLSKNVDPPKIDPPKADGLATAVADLPVLLQFADCVPVILYDTKRSAFVVLHAGWRGTASGIVAKGLELLLKKTGSAPSDIAAAIGPAIGDCCYPTGPEVLEGLSSTTQNLKGLVKYRKGMPHPDLKGINARQLKEAGVKKIDVCPLCTSCNPKLFYSHRKSKGRTGHQGAIAALTAIILLFSTLLSSNPSLAAQDNTDTADTKNSAKSNIHLTPLTPKLAQPKLVKESPVQAALQSTTQPAAQPASKNPIEPSLEQLERVTYGTTNSADPIEQRLTLLEQSIFHTTFESQSSDERIRHLLMTLLGTGGNSTDKSDVAAHEKSTAQNQANEEEASLHKELSTEELYRFALAQINDMREQQGMHILQWDSTALRVAQQHALELCRRVPDNNSLTVDNPDLYYTKLGGTDALTESIVTLKVDENTGNNKATVLRLLQAINKHQDDRDSVFSPDATHFGLAYGTSANSKLVACVETVARHTAMHSIPKQIHPGEKIEVKGVVMEPYHFKLISLAWEGENSPNKADNSEDAEESAALYFPPLDYVAYGQKSQKGEHEKLVNALRITGVVAAIAGGMFIPPVAIAAPLIAMSGSMPSEPHAISEIPVHGGVKVTGSLFYATVPVTHQNKEGLYYVTVWASTGENHRPVPVSRRVIVAKAEISESDEDSSIKISTQEKPQTVKEIQ